MNYNSKCNFLVIGTGISGLAFALKVADLGHVTILNKTSSEDGNSIMAQGGIAAVIAEEDSFENHIKDTIQAGAGLCRLDSVYQIIAQAPACIEYLVKLGVAFDISDQKTSAFGLTREGGHSHRRILHIQDHTGREIHKTLLTKANQHPNIEILNDHFAIDLITSKKVDPYNFDQNHCLGAYVLDKKNQIVKTILAPWTIIATGGVGKAYLYTSNWSGATGDGVAMAYRAGARVANMEFLQFHPTCLYHPMARNFLISEALRGEGGRLVTNQGEDFMEKYHPMKSLAPRDIVARSIDAEMKKSGSNCVYLDMTHLNREFLKTRFPVIYDKCLSLGIDMANQPIPVVPAAHYLCGGVFCNAQGQNDIYKLLVIGESACTGLHGANRLASNSLLECIAMAINAEQFIRKNFEKHSENDKLDSIKKPKDWEYYHSENQDELIVISHMWEEIRRLMWNYVGIVRSNRRLARAKMRLYNLKQEVHDYYWNLKVNSDILELRNIALVASLTVDCALRRKESRGINYNLDFPKMESWENPGNDTILIP